MNATDDDYITPANMEVLHALEMWWAANDGGPTLRELGEEVGIAGPTALEHLRRLVDAGYVEKLGSGRQSRCYRPVSRKTYRR